MENSAQKSKKKWIIIWGIILVVSIATLFLALFFGGVFKENKPADREADKPPTASVKEDQKEEKPQVTPADKIAEEDEGSEDTDDSAAVETEKFTNSLHERFNEVTSVIGLTGKEIKNNYGKFTYMGTMEGGDYFTVSGLQYQIIFGTRLSYSAKDKARLNNAYSNVCVGVGGFAEKMFPTISYYGDDGINVEKFATDIADGAKYKIESNKVEGYDIEGDNDWYHVAISVKGLIIYVTTENPNIVKFDNLVEIINKKLVS
jgi:hypothetical protein